jgi:hypothetical protein
MTPEIAFQILKETAIHAQASGILKLHEAVQIADAIDVLSKKFQLENQLQKT